MATLFSLSVSPWSEKAKWAMDYSKVSYERKEFTPMISTPLVRLKTKNLLGKITAPLLIDGDEVFGESFDIAKHANSLSKEKSLFPSDKQQEIRYWNTISENILEAGRALVVTRMQTNREACLKSLPPEIPDALRPLMLPVAKTGLFYLKKKYGFSEENVQQYQQVIRENLLVLRDALANGSPYLLDEFSYADICMAVTLQVIAPIQNAYIMLDSDTLQCWSNNALAKEFEDLIAWRDSIYQKHRS